MGGRWRQIKTRRANWAELRERRHTASMMIHHDVYHAGEIDHVRPPQRGNDRWRWRSS